MLIGLTLLPWLCISASSERIKCRAADPECGPDTDLTLCEVRGVSSLPAAWRCSPRRTGPAFPAPCSSHCRTAGCWCSVRRAQRESLKRARSAYKLDEVFGVWIGDGVHLNGAVVVVGEVRQRGPVLAQCVVAGVGVVVVVAVRNICRPK